MLGAWNFPCQKRYGLHKNPTDFLCLPVTKGINYSSVRKRDLWSVGRDIMHTDVKIGIAVGALVIVGAVLYVTVFNRNKTQQPQSSAAKPAETPKKNDIPRRPPTGTDALRSGAPAVSAQTPSTMPAAVTAAPAPLPIESSDQALRNLFHPTVETPPARPAVDTSRVGDIRSPGPAVSATIAAPAVPEFYVVQANDTYWAIAQKIYGNGKYASLIQQANLGIDPTRLHAGQKIKLPPAPKDALAAKTPTTKPAPTIAANIASTRPAANTAKYSASPTPVLTKAASGASPTPGRPFFPLKASANP